MKGFLIAVALGISHVNGWSYDITASDGPGNWGGVCDGGTQQSPIDIDRSDVIPISSYMPFKFYGYDDRSEIMDYTNDGDTVHVEIRKGQDRRRLPYVVEGGLTRLDQFQFSHLSFHWGVDNDVGSEHTIDGESYPLEMHITHFNRKYGQSSNSSLYSNIVEHGHNATDNLAIFGVLFKLQRHHNDKLWPLIHGIQRVRVEGTEFEATDEFTFKLQDLLPHDLDHFWRYQGSLTSPGPEPNDCFEVVMWTVFKDTVGISREQMDVFRSLLYTGAAGNIPMTTTHRPAQPINGRNVYYVNTNQYNDDCDNSGLWKEEDHIYWRESWDEYSFLGAVHHCIGAEAEDGPYVGLVPVGKLRHFRNRWSDQVYFDEKEFKNKFCRARMYRVNAMKAPDGRWREYPDGNEVLFHHYPEFDKVRGDVGDTIVWDSHTDRLIIQHDERDYHALCYREKERCHRCQGFDIGHECFDAGDCIDRECACDVNFNGTFCQLAPIEEYGIFVFEGTTGGDSFYDFRTGYACKFYGSDQMSDSSTDGGTTGTYIFDTVVTCDVSGTVHCTYYVRETQSWVEFTRNAVQEHVDAASEVFRINGKDKFWIIAGGIDDSGTDVGTTSINLLTKDYQWQEGPTLEQKLSNFCVVQISDCEFAVIGGDTDDSTGTDASDIGADDWSDEIRIYNFETNEWTAGPSLDEGRVRHQCVRIKDPYTHHWSVVIACGYHRSSSSRNEDANTVEVWDLVTNQIKIYTSASNTSAQLGSFACPVDDYFEFADELTEYQAVFARGYNSSSDSSAIYLFDLEQGFIGHDSLTGSSFLDSEDAQYGAVVPSGFFDCYFNP